MTITELDPLPSRAAAAGLGVGVAIEAPAGATRVVLVADGDSLDGLGPAPADLMSSGLTHSAGSCVVLPGSPPTVVAGVGSGGATEVRDGAGTGVRAVAASTAVALDLTRLTMLDLQVVQAAVEGALLGRYRYDGLKRTPTGSNLESLTVVVGADRLAEAEAAVRRGTVFARTTAIARDLANTPPRHLTASRIADLAVSLGPEHGFTVEVFGKDELIELGCGGLLGVNAGSDEPPRMVRMRYAPDGAAAHLTLVGKGIMYDSGGISLKPSDAVHATMKNDMSGAGAVLAVMTALADLDCPVAVTAYLMCTDNMPSGTAMCLGDVITMRGGTTVEVVNTDAEGRLVMADALVLATEEPTDAIIDIATLTGACMRALGTEIAGVMGNDDGLVEAIREAGDATDELVWPFPLHKSYRRELASQVADLKNLGGANAGQITAALFLSEFVGTVPWAHIDIAGTAQSDTDRSWRTAGCTGFGARLLLELALGFEVANG